MLTIRDGSRVVALDASTWELMLTISMDTVRPSVDGRNWLNFGASHGALRPWSRWCARNPTRLHCVPGIQSKPARQIFLAARREFVHATDIRRFSLGCVEPAGR